MFTTLIILACITQIHGLQHASDKCNRGWQKLGCFHDRVVPDRPLPNELLNRRDKINHNNDGYFINWMDFNTTLHALACKCAYLAFKKNHPFFGLQFYGECWSGPQNPSYDRDGKTDADRCLNGDYKTCNDKDNRECIGKASTNYIYRVGDIKMVVDGGWSEWGIWSPCSASCNGGVRSRVRTCTKPTPENGGKNCAGESEQIEKCNEEKCYPVCEKKMEVVFALDSSTSVTRPGWNKTLEFVVRLTNKFIINPSTIHVGAIAFERKVYLSFKPSDPLYWSNTVVKMKTATIPYQYGGTRIDLAIDYVRENLFCDECGVRKDVPKVLIVITDGRNNVGGVLEPAAEKMRESGSHLLAVGVGPSVSQQELVTIAGSKERTVTVENYDYIYSYLNKILKLTCESH